MNVVERTIEAGRFLAKDPVGTWQSGTTPHAVIHRDGKSRVLYFAPDEAKHAPVFVSMPLINTWTVFDLLPGKSVVEALVKEGFPVYLLDWGRRGFEDREVSVSRLIEGTLRRSVDRVRRHAGTKPNAIGYCVGGTFLAAYCALHPEDFGRVAFVATPIDFHASGRLHRWADPKSFPVDAIIDGWGNFPADLLKTSFDWLRPSNMTRKYKSLVDRIESESFRDVWAALEKWNNDAVDFPGEAYREYVKRCYFDNSLMNPGHWKLDGRAIDLANVKIPALSIAASNDHIVPPPAAHALSDVWGGEVDTETIRGGHVGICIGRSLPRALASWLADSDA